MAFSLEHEVLFDGTDDASAVASNRAGLFYLFDVFLPTRGWPVNVSGGTSGAVKRGFGVPHRDYLNGGDIVYSYSWCTIPTSAVGAYITIYEDGTYTSVPGDLMTSTRNSVLWAYNATGSIGASWKFWVSDEDNSLFMVTRHNEIIMWGCVGDLTFRYPNSGKSQSPSVDEWRTSYFPFGGALGKYVNLPGTNTSNSEEPLEITIPSANERPLNESVIRNFTVGETNSLAGFINYNDVRLYVPAASSRSSAITNPSLLGTYAAYKYLSGSEWWLVTSAPAGAGMAFYFGTTEPNLS